MCVLFLFDINAKFDDSKVCSVPENWICIMKLGPTSEAYCIKKQLRPYCDQDVFQSERLYNLPDQNLKKTKSLFTGSIEVEELQPLKVMEFDDVKVRKERIMPFFS